ncbi:Uu.00g087030.m01.CDS01 [Anthostomella pinea]|uniref:Uu.00g087030.m01.CDS01 n=1 Tax=Anthostomella pinea TaxID=933095 RepID=A0AAI8YJZ5_9PEZI|nr:Uu.00g087030.m01.CDS01 [Anthostomella pinea]
MAILRCYRGLPAINSSPVLNSTTAINSTSATVNLKPSLRLSGPGRVQGPYQQHRPARKPVPVSDNINVTLNATVTTYYGQTVKIVGSCPELGSWNVDNAPAMSAHSTYSDGNHLWQLARKPIKVGTKFEYKLVKVAPGQDPEWEGGNNREVDLKDQGGGEQAVQGSWR